MSSNDDSGDQLRKINWRDTAPALAEYLDRVAAERGEATPVIDLTAFGKGDEALAGQGAVANLQRRVAWEGKIKRATIELLFRLAPTIEAPPGSDEETQRRYRLESQRARDSVRAAMRKALGGEEGGRVPPYSKGRERSDDASWVNTDGRRYVNVKGRARLLEP